jgi:hypothetical protein
VTRAEVSAKQRFDELIVWYVNGTLEPEDRRWMDNYLRDHPGSRHELAWHDQLKSANDIRDMQIPARPGLRSLLEQVKADKAKRSASWFDKIAGYFAALSARQAYALAAAVVLAQAIALGVLMKEVRDRDQIISDYNATRAVGREHRPDLPTLQVTFKNDATERQIRLLLTSIQGTIVEGPRQLGDYTVAVRAGSLDEAKSALAQSPIVEVVSAPSPPASEQ